MLLVVPARILAKFWTREVWCPLAGRKLLVLFSPLQVTRDAIIITCVLRNILGSWPSKILLLSFVMCFLGGYKGYGLAMMVEVLCGISAGANYATNIRTWDTNDLETGGYPNLVVDVFTLPITAYLAEPHLSVTTFTFSTLLVLRSNACFKSASPLVYDIQVLLTCACISLPFRF